MIYGYARVSTEAQDLTSQLAQLKAAGCEKVFREKITGTTADRELGEGADHLHHHASGWGGWPRARHPPRIEAF
jgi:hypothetical protein